MGVFYCCSVDCNLYFSLACNLVYCFDEMSVDDRLLVDVSIRMIENKCLYTQVYKYHRRRRRLRGTQMNKAKEWSIVHDEHRNERRRQPSDRTGCRTL